MSLRLITPPAADPVTTAEAKAYARVETTDDDTLIGNLIKNAVADLDGYSGKLRYAIITQTWELVLDEFPTDGAVEIPLRPLASITSIKYDDADGNEQTLDAADYYVDAVSRPGWVVLNSDESWPTLLDAVNAVRIQFVAGVAAANVPWDMKYEIMRLVAWRYDNRAAEPYPPEFWGGSITKYRGMVL